MINASRCKQQASEICMACGRQADIGPLARFTRAHGVRQHAARTRWTGHGHARRSWVGSDNLLPLGIGMRQLALMNGVCAGWERAGTWGMGWLVHGAAADPRYGDDARGGRVIATKPVVQLGTAARRMRRDGRELLLARSSHAREGRAEPRGARNASSVGTWVSGLLMQQAVSTDRHLPLARPPRHPSSHMCTLAARRSHSGGQRGQSWNQRVAVLEVGINVPPRTCR